MNKIEDILKNLTGYGRNFFIAIMVVYLFTCLLALAIKIIMLVPSVAIFDFIALKHILNDALYTLIILAIVKTLFINNNYDYAVTFLEIGFVVILRKLILLDIVPDEMQLVLSLGVVSALFFVLIIFNNRIRSQKDSD